MSSRITVLTIDARDPSGLADFWCRVLDWQIMDDVDEGVGIAPKGESESRIAIFAVPEAKTQKNRLHLDLSADGITAQAELARLLELGARRVDVGQPSDASWTVLADPEGNEFCLLGMGD
ncbi:VOC family protein [Actinoalloteichus sp. GBA129-24]|uniref:VOC family protein n=1 Tax=Actinoalloteichus sp. GBA129-24 TaxID=1612551 RepID=UPI0009509984|nr:VOC family protein [Actinoalloteichus sp. GBA129-24]APU22004.1 Glyoxalase-like domain [Actinoalloteichus sp. GBA129-24]